MLENRMMDKDKEKKKKQKEFSMLRATVGLVSFFLVAFVLQQYILKNYSEYFVRKPLYKGQGFVFEIPEGWVKGENIKREFISFSDDPGKVVTFYSPTLDPKTELPEASISVFSQKFEQALWIEDSIPDIVHWIKDHNNTILGQGKINVEYSIGFSVNYRDNWTKVVYLDLYLASDSKTFVVISYATKEDKFLKYIKDFEKVRNSLEFRFGIF